MANQILIKNTLLEMRNLSTSEIEGLQGTAPVYTGVKLLGYYKKGDTPAPIIYYVAETDPGSDNGGSVVEVGGIKLLHDFGKRIDIRYFGAVGNNLNDDTNSIKNAALYCAGIPYKPELYFPGGFIFVAKDTLYIDSGIDIVMESTISYKGPKDRPALIVGSEDSKIFFAKLKINITATSNRSDWTNEDYKGIILRNCSSCDIHIVQASFFTTNVECIGVKTGFVYNEIKLGDISNGKIALVLNSNDKGWCNENNWYGGKISVASAVNPDKSRYGIVIKSNDKYRQNNNVFYKTSIELNKNYLTSSALEAVCVVIENGRHNEWISMRDELNSKTVRTLNDSFCNRVQAGFSEPFARYDNRVEDLGNYPSTIFTTNIQAANQELGWPLLNLSSLRSYFTQYSGEKVSAKAPLRLQNSTSSNPTAAIDNITLTEKYVEIAYGAGVGVRLDTSIRKRFNVALGYTDTNHIGRLYLVCRDADMMIIPNPKPLVKISGRYEIYESTQFGGHTVALGTGALVDRDPGNIMQFFAVDDSVKYVDLFISSYQAPAQIKSFQIFSLDGQSSVLPYKEFDSKLSEIMPIGVTYNGDFVLSSTGQQLGWKLSGGVWKEIGGNATASSKGFVNQSAAITNSLQPDAVDLNSAIALVNELKEKLNAKFEADRASGQQVY